MDEVLGVWSENADRLVPRGTIEWAKGPMGFAGSINGKPVAAVRTNGAGSWTARIEGWQWTVTPDMATARFNQIPGDKIATTPVKGFESASAAKAELQRILSPDFMAHSAPSPALRPKG